MLIRPKSCFVFGEFFDVQRLWKVRFWGYINAWDRLLFVVKGIVYDGFVLACRPKLVMHWSLVCIANCPNCFFHLCAMHLEVVATFFCLRGIEIPLMFCCDAFALTSPVWEYVTWRDFAVYGKDLALKLAFVTGWKSFGSMRSWFDSMELWGGWWC